MDPNPYDAPKKSQDIPASRPVWSWMLKGGCMTMVIGVLAVVSAHLLSPPRYAYAVIALTERFVWLGLIFVIAGGVGWALSRRHGKEQKN